MYASQLQTYKTVQKSTMSSREIEAAALTNAAIKLAECQRLWDQKGHFQRLDEALVLNQRIWTIFQSELSKEDNPLPKKLREDILSLSLFIDKRIFEIMSEPAPEKLSIIVNINLNLAAGLRSTPR
jgi:flagellar biosynthesis activator protein FlaF